MNSVAIIGAGVSGLTAAHTLQKSGIPFTLYEKSRGVSGRAATRFKHGCYYDHGANYFKLSHEQTRSLVLNELDSSELITINKPVFTFDHLGVISEGNATLNQDEKYNYRTGIKTLGKLIATQLPEQSLKAGTKITGINRSENGWTLSTAEEEFHHSQVIVTIPLPQVIPLLKLDDADSQISHPITSSRYYQQFTFVFGFDEELKIEREYHAMINTDRTHEVAWLSFENDKEGHVPKGKTVVVAQMNPDWSAQHIDENRDALGVRASKLVSKLIGTPKPNWIDSQRWMFAHPQNKMEQEHFADLNKQGLHFCGDAFVGKGRVEEAMLTGINTAKTILKSF